MNLINCLMNYYRLLVMLAGWIEIETVNPTELDFFPRRNEIRIMRSTNSSLAQVFFFFLILIFLRPIQFNLIFEISFK